MSTPIKDDKELKAKLKEITKDMSETERLEFNTKIQKAMDTGEEIHKYMTVRMMMIKGVGKRSMQLLFISLACIGASVFFDVKGMQTLGFAFNALWLIFFIVHLVFENMKSRAEGQFDGAVAMLEILGHMDKDDEPPRGKKRKKKSLFKSMFARPKEFFERITKGKEAYGTS